MLDIEARIPCVFGIFYLSVITSGTAKLLKWKKLDHRGMNQLLYFI